MYLKYIYNISDRKQWTNTCILLIWWKAFQKSLITLMSDCYIMSYHTFGGEDRNSTFTLGEGGFQSNKLNLCCLPTCNTMSIVVVKAKNYCADSSKSF